MPKLVALLLAVLLCGAQSVAAADDFPNRPVRVVVTISAGSTADVLARTVAEPLSRRLGRSVVVENRPGAGGNVAGAFVAKEPADGHTLLLATISSHGINPGMYGAKMPYDAMADFAHVVAVASVPNLLIAHPSIPSLAEFVARAKSRPGELVYSSGGAGTSHHLAAEWFNAVAGIKTQHVPYRGTPEAVTAVVRGDAAVMFPNAPNAESLARDGQVRALAVTASKRLRTLPDVPTMAELGYPGFEVTGWFGLVAPAGTPQPIVDKLNAEVRAVLAEPAVIEALGKQGFDIMGGSASEFREFNAAEIKKWSEVVRSAGAAIQ